MACGSCGSRSSATTKFPYVATLRDGTKVEVHSAAELRTEQARADQRMRAAARTKGYTVK